MVADLGSKNLFRFNLSQNSSFLADRKDSEIGYGFTLLNGEWQVYPYGGVSLTEGNFNEVRLGNWLRIGRDISFEIEGSEKFDSSEDHSRKFQLNGGVSW